MIYLLKLWISLVSSLEWPGLDLNQQHFVYETNTLTFIDVVSNLINY